MFVKGQVVIPLQVPPHYRGWADATSWKRIVLSRGPWTFDEFFQDPYADPKETRILCLTPDDATPWIFFIDQIVIPEPKEPPTIPSVVITKGVIHEEDVSPS